MELINHSGDRNGQHNVAQQTEMYRNTTTNASDTTVNQYKVDKLTPIQAQTIYLSPARSLYLDIQAMTHYSLAQIAQLCDIPLSTFYRLAMGTTRNPLYKTFDKLLRTYFIVLLNHAQSTAELN